MSSSIQMDFTLRTSTNVKTVHLLGSWDNYQGQLPLSKDSRKKGGWKGAFRFQGATLAPGHRYWYYYIVDGYHVSHDPAKDSTIEPTTGRQLNILDVPASTYAKPSSSSRHSKRHSRPMSIDIPKGRAVSPSKIRSPHPVKPNQTRHIVQADYNTLEHLSQQFSHATLDSSDDESSDEDSDVPSLTSSRSSASSSPSSLSSTSSCCTCERYGITRGGDRVKLDCGGTRCGSEGGSSCSSDSEDEYRRGTTRRNGMVVYD
ncbi:hypothetical protein P152DRAFT_297809 [Eremomyces bilateralis CBS 781.70]|uniref:GTP-binding protein EsdC n=1 Tax=Eremomyces bilateralis CBS 781.70 TaxID=1392243 RepID=A0A6G1G7Q7_9PEZI|nr:uncharacterized protein P152DRAFT_297809 [Eremomyces bilateralis CBS 781.70]KAF1813920.1 hypothetical protein P152DRAFT_297809 [Eremomyces bilateralis CBS 781.70]